MTLTVNSVSPKSALWLLIGVTSFIHLFISPWFNLGADEAHYTLYGVFLDWSYFDHPPMIGWLQAIALLFSQSELALRSIPVVLFIGTSLALYSLIEKLEPDNSDWLPFLTVAVVHSGLMFQLIGLTMVPDVPLLFVSVMAVNAIVDLLRDTSLRRWLFLGVWLGLAGLSKYTAVTLVFSSMLLVAYNRRFDLLKGPGIWLAIAVSLLLILPIIYWNFINDWISFSYQIHHGTKGSEWGIARLVLSQTIQAVLYTHGIYLAGLVVIAKCLRPGMPLNQQVPLFFALPVLLLFGWNSGYEETLPHWPIFGWLMLITLIVTYIHGFWQKRWLRIAVYANTAYSLILVLAVQSQLLYPWMPFPDNTNLLHDVHGWQQAADKAIKLKASEKTGKQLKLFVTSWPFASRLAWYARPEHVMVADQRYDQFDIWYGSPQDGDAGIVVIPAYSKKNPPKTGSAGHFSSCQQRGNLPIKVGSRIITTYYFFFCDGYSAGVPR